MTATIHVDFLYSLIDSENGSVLKDTFQDPLKRMQLFTRDGQSVVHEVLEKYFYMSRNENLYETEEVLLILMFTYHIERQYILQFLLNSQCAPYAQSYIGRMINKEINQVLFPVSVISGKNQDSHFYNIPVHILGKLTAKAAYSQTWKKD